jgi:hypothetical protein
VREANRRWQERRFPGRVRYPELVAEAAGEVCCGS